MIAGAPNELLVDEYELAMVDSYVAEGKDSVPVAFELFARELPPNRGYLVAAGLERAVEVLTELRFGEDALDTYAGKLDGVGERIEVLPDRILLYAHDGDAAAAEVHRRELQPSSVLVRRSSLEDVFLHLTGRTLVD